MVCVVFVKNYLYGLEGSYWIYRNTKTADLDTQTCMGFYYDSIKVRGTLNYSKYKIFEYDKISRTIYSSFYKTNIVDNTLDDSPDSRSFNNGRIVLKRYVGELMNGIFRKDHAPALNALRIGT